MKFQGKAFSKELISNVPWLAEEVVSAGGNPNQREIKLRFWSAGPADGPEGWRCSGDWAAGLESMVGEAAVLTAVAGGRGEEAGMDCDCGTVWEAMGACGVLGLELPVEAPLGGTMGDWEPEEGLWPLAGPGEP